MVSCKKIEFENTSVENLARLRAEFNEQKDSTDVDEATRKIFREYYEEFTKTTVRIINKKLSFAELRTLNKELIAGDKFLQESMKIKEKS